MVVTKLKAPFGWLYPLARSQALFESGEPLAFCLTWNTRLYQQYSYEVCITKVPSIIFQKSGFLPTWLMALKQDDLISPSTNESIMGLVLALRIAFRGDVA